MHTSSFVALSQQRLLRRSLDVIAHNLANVSTPGFKKEFLLLEKQHKLSGPGSEVSFVAEKGLSRDMATGPLETTHNPLDIAIVGPSFLAVETEQGVGYTRNGSLTIDATRRLVTQSGQPVLSSSFAPIVVPDGTSFINIGSDGTVATSLGVVGQIGLFDFAQPEKLEKIESGIYQSTEAATPSASPQVLQGAKELSNVQPVLELTQMIDVLRNYQYNQNLIDQEDERQKESIEKLVPKT